MTSNAQTRRQKKFLEARADWQTQARGTNEDEFQIFVACADDGKGGDITHGGAPLPSFDEWMNR